MLARPDIAATLAQWWGPGVLDMKGGVALFIFAMRALREVCDQDKRAVLLVTHNPRDATFADEVRFLVDGRIADLVLTGKERRIEDVHAALAKLAI